MTHMGPPRPVPGQPPQAPPAQYQYPAQPVMRSGYPPAPQPIQVQVQTPTKAITQNRMGYGEILFHVFMSFCTAGLWLFVVASRRRKLRSVTRLR